MKPVPYIKYLLLFLLVFQPLCHANEHFTGKVVKITDGDTLTVLVDRKQVRIRLAEIDCPEKRQPWGNKAKQALSNLAFSKIIKVNPVTVGRYGRIIAHLIVNDREINKELVRTGNCWVYRKYAKDKTLYTLENEARDTKRGLWGLPENQRIPPWEWRRKK